MAENKRVLPARPSLTGKQVYLHPATAEDVVNFQYWFLQAEPESMTCRPLPFKTAAEASEAFKKEEKSPNKQSFAIVKKEDNTPVGSISFFNYNSLNRSAELDILIDPDEQKNGFGKEAMRILIKYLFKFRDLNRVYVQTAAFNSPSIKLFESLGFKQDGSLRNHHFYNGEFYDDLIYSFLRFELNW